MFGIDVPENLKQKMKTILKTSKNCGAAVILKGKIDVITGDDKIKLNSTGNPGMTVGGTGDCLAGLVGGLMAQGHDAFEAAFLGAYINGKVGDLAAGDYGYNFTTTDLLDYIPKAFYRPLED